MSLQDCKTLLYYSSDDEMMAFITQLKWDVDLGKRCVKFNSAGSGIGLEQGVVADLLGYAKELEQIV